MRFESPWLLSSLLVLAGAVGLWLAAERRRVRYAVRYPNLEVLATVLPRHSWLRLVPPALVALALGSLLLALARPHVARLVVRERATVVLVLDTSRSMQARDVAPTRLGAAQEAVRTFLERVPGRVRVGLVVFAGEAQVATPPTQDHELVRTAVDQIDTFLVFGGTAIGDALQRAVEVARRAVGEPPAGAQAAGAPRGETRALAQAGSCTAPSPASILFLSDGAQTRGLLQPLEGAALAREACIPVYTIALGTPEGVIERGPFGFFPPDQSGQLIPVPPDPDTLRAIANLTGGEFSEARDAETLSAAYAGLASRLGREPGESEVTFLLVALAAGLLVLAGVLSAAVSPRLP